MRKTKAAYKALREHTGVSHANLGRMLGVNERTVKRWEDGRYGNPPDDAWDILLELRDRQLDMIDFAIQKATDSGVEIVSINYYRTQAQFEAFGRDEGDYRMANANARAVATALEAMGFEVEYSYPDEGGYTETPRNEHS